VVERFMHGPKPNLRLLLTRVDNCLAPDHLDRTKAAPISPDNR
jgi:hypothetical protein